MKYLFIILFFGFLISCQQKAQTNVNSFKKGKFKTILEDGKTVSYAIRKDSLQLETYNNKIDTFKIKWINSFEYVLLKKNPKTLLDSTPFHVKITAIKGNSYDFTAYYKGSNFKQKGKATKLSKTKSLAK
ncbi:MAG: DNA topoisomerase IV [Flavobacteriaceae bacterium]|nr:DNA topoisomerase IV [Flavobacteriaceae bacterium]